MSKSIKISQKQQERLKLTPQIMQSMKILQLNAVDLNTFLKKKALDNPFLDIKSNFDNDHKFSFRQIADTRNQISLNEHLLNQVNSNFSNNPLEWIIKLLINNLNNQGYLKINEKVFLKKYKINISQLAEAEILLKSLDPSGVGATNLQECLYLQAKRDDSAPKGVLGIINSKFDLLVKHKWAKMFDELGLTKSEGEKALLYIKTLKANPASDYMQNDEINYIVPDAKVIINKNGKFSLFLTKWGQPELIFSDKNYQELKTSNDIVTNQYVRRKKAEYQSLKRSLFKRQETLLAIIEQIITIQHDFFLNHESLKVLLLKDIASKLHVNISTVSRAINGKYLETDFGIIPLKKLFCKESNFKNKKISVSMIKNKILSLIHTENKNSPLSDNEIKQILCKKGFPISRRTVAKYRKELTIPSSEFRKDLKIIEKG